ncbi:MAG: hypothetical protein AAFZ18_16970 [Myxococcota bacterium]
MARALTYNATLVRRQEIADGLAIFGVELDEPLEPDAQGRRFQPGQYVTLGINRSHDDPEDTRPASVLRPMTIASSPLEAEMELYVQYVSQPESRLPLTHLLWPMEVGERLYVRPSATGHFIDEAALSELPGRHRLMVAEGTGLAPFLSYLRGRVADDPGVRLDRHALLLEAKNPEHLGYREELEALAVERGLVFIPILSRPHECSQWAGATGRVEDLLGAQLEATEGQLGFSLRPEDTVVLVCGLAPTLAGTIRNLLARGFVPEHKRLRKKLHIQDETPSTIRCEQYDAAPLFDLKDADLMARLAELRAVVSS